MDACMYAVSFILEELIISDFVCFCLCCALDIDEFISRSFV